MGETWRPKSRPRQHERSDDPGSPREARPYILAMCLPCCVLKAHLSGTIAHHSVKADLREFRVLVSHRVQGFLAAAIDLASEVEHYATRLPARSPPDDSCPSLTSYHSPIEMQDQLDGVVVLVTGNVHIVYHVLDQEQTPSPRRLHPL
jgi:hypothetical protein